MIPPQQSIRVRIGLLPVLLVFLVLVIFTSSLGLAAQPIKVGVYENAPKIFTRDGQPAGILVDIIEEIGRREGWQISYVSGSWADNLDRLARGEIDLMPDMAYSAERSTVFDYPKVPALSSWFQIYAPKGHGIHSILDLNGKRIMVLDRSIQQQAFERLRQGFELRCTIVGVPDYEAMFAKVMRGEADVAVTNRFYGMMHARQFGLEDTAILFEPSDLYYAATKGDPKKLLPIIDRHLSELKADADSVYYRSLRAWTLEQIQFKLPLWLKVTAGVGGAVLLLSLLWSILLKQQVNHRTRELTRINAEMEERIKERTAELMAITREQLSIFESAGLGIVVLRNRVIVRCNRKMEELTGFNQVELIGMSTRPWYRDEQSYEKAAKEVYAQLARGETHHRSQQIERKDGSLFWARLSLRAIDEHNPLAGSVGIIEDISYEREASEMMREAMRRALDADRIKSAFLATMSHELRTPLNSIIGFTGILMQGLAGPLNDEQHKQLGMVQNSSRHLLSLINDVLDISKIEAGQLELSIAPVDLRASLQKVLTLVAPIAEQKKIALRGELAADLGEIHTDQRRLEQIVINLLNNAIKFTEQGSVTLDCRRQGERYLLRIIDTGIGMHQEELSRIFQPFHQVESGLARAHEGTGLGLAICKRLVGRMGGTITVESQPGAGSMFIVDLPVQPVTAHIDHEGNGGHAA